MTSDERQVTSDDKSGHDLDAWRTDEALPMVVIPTPETPCVLKVDGECPAGCDACVAFAEDIASGQSGGVTVTGERETIRATRP
jgi:hypothetical protein